MARRIPSNTDQGIDPTRCVSSWFPSTLGGPSERNCCAIDAILFRVPMGPAGAVERLPGPLILRISHPLLDGDPMPLPLMSVVVLPLIMPAISGCRSSTEAVLGQCIAVIGQPRVEGAKPVRYSRRKAQGIHHRESCCGKQ